jgi:hypothetical protein
MSSELIFHFKNYYRKQNQQKFYSKNRFNQWILSNLEIFFNSAIDCKEIFKDF